MCHSSFILSVSLNCKYLEGEDQALNGLAALSSSTLHSFPLVFVFFSLCFQPSSVLFIPSLWLCQPYCTVQCFGAFDKKMGHLGRQRSEVF